MCRIQENQGYLGTDLTQSKSVIQALEVLPAQIQVSYNLLPVSLQGALPAYSTPG